MPRPVPRYADERVRRKNVGLVRSIAVFDGGRRVSPRRIPGREALAEWLDDGSLVELG